MTEHTENQLKKTTDETAQKSPMEIMEAMTDLACQLVDAAYGPDSKLDAEQVETAEKLLKILTPSLLTLRGTREKAERYLRGE